MIGLMTKDFLILRKAIRSYALLMLFYCAMVMMGMFSPEMIVGFAQMMTMMLCLSCFSLDDVAGFSTYAATLPVKRSTLVGARYATATALSCGMAVLSLVYSTVSTTVFRQGELFVMLFVLGAVIAVGMVAQAVLLPLCYKVGVERTRPVMMGLFLIPTGLIFAWSQWHPDMVATLDWLSANAELILLSALVIGALALTISWKISTAIVEQMEF